MFYVYTYRDPRPGKARVPVYVGKGKIHRKVFTTRKQFYSRAYEHLRRCANVRLRNLLKNLNKLGLEPIVEISRIFKQESGAFSLECSLIAKYGRRDLKTGTLFNNTAGGEGTVDYWNEANRRRQAKHGRRLSKLRWKDPEQHKNVILQNQARWADEEYRQEVCGSMSRSAQVRANDPVWKAAHSERIKASWRDPVRKEAILASRTRDILGRWVRVQK